MIWTEPPAFASLQLGPPPAGSVEVRMLPVRLPAAQSRVDTQATPSRSPGPPGVPASVQADAPPVGLVETKIRPSRATATQSEGVPQETPRRSSELLSWIACHWPEVGSVEVSTLPPLELFDPPETATHRAGEGQETAVRCVAPSPSFTTVGDQAPAPPVGSVET